MHAIGFDRDQYLALQSEHIAQRRQQFGGTLYLEFGGKLVDDMHASRVLPGFTRDNKIVMLAELADEAEIVVAVNALDFQRRKMREDLGITYEDDVFRHIDMFREYGLYVGNVVITRWSDSNDQAHAFKRKLEARGIKVARHYPIEGYPNNIDLIVSDEGLGRNENVAYEAATVDLDDVNMIDYFHLKAHGETTVNYNRDIEAFPVLRRLLEKIMGASPYQSPTDMGVNMAGFCISNDEVCREASKQEIIRRWYKALALEAREDLPPVQSERAARLMTAMNLSSADRPVVAPALERARETGYPAAAMQLSDGRIVTGKTSDLLGPCSAMLLNAMKLLAGIDDDEKLLAPEQIEPIQKLKTEHLGSRNPRLHTDEVLIALAGSARSNERAAAALNQLPKLAGCDVHSSVLLGSVDEGILRQLGMNVTAEPVHATKGVYHKH